MRPFAAPVLALLLAAGCGAAEPEPRETVDPTLYRMMLGETPVPTTAPLPMVLSGLATDDGWRIASLTVACDAFGQWAGTAVVRNTTRHKGSVLLELSLLREDTPLTVLYGVVEHVPAGAEVSTRVASGDGCLSEVLSYSFAATPY